MDRLIAIAKMRFMQIGNMLVVKFLVGCRL